jgi:hypothetical protein
VPASDEFVASAGFGCFAAIASFTCSASCQFADAKEDHSDYFFLMLFIIKSRKTLNMNSDYEKKKHFC